MRAGFRGLLELLGIFPAMGKPPPTPACLELTDEPTAALMLTDEPAAALTLTDEPVAVLTLTDERC